MKGIVFTEFLDMVEATFGLEVVDSIIENSNLQSEVHLEHVESIHYQDIKEILVEDKNNTDFMIVTK